jgi:hypothetical protein
MMSFIPGQMPPAAHDGQVRQHTVSAVEACEVCSRCMRQVSVSGNVCSAQLRVCSNEAGFTCMTPQLKQAGGHYDLYKLAATP